MEVSGVRKEDIMDTLYYLDKNDVVLVTGEKYYKLKLREDIVPNAKKGQVCALVSANIGDGLKIEGCIFSPSSSNTENMPIIRAPNGGKLTLKKCSFEGNVVISVGAMAKMSLSDTSVRGDVKISTLPLSSFEAKNCDIVGEKITIKDCDMANYSISGMFIEIENSSLGGNKNIENSINGNNISIKSIFDEKNIIENSNFEGDNIVIKGPSNVIDVKVLDGTLIDNSEVVCEEGELTLNKATIIEGSMIATFGNNAKIEDSTIKNSDITLGENVKQSKLKDKDKNFEIVGSVVNECKGDMPQKTINSICEKCIDMCQYKTVEECEVYNEKYEQPIFSGILRRFGMEKPFYSDGAYKKYIAPGAYYDLDNYHNAVEKEKAEKSDEGVSKSDEDEIVF